MDREDDGGVALDFSRHGGHGVESPGGGSQVGADGIETHFTVQNPGQNKGPPQKQQSRSAHRKEKSS